MDVVLMEFPDTHLLYKPAWLTKIFSESVLLYIRFRSWLLLLPVITIAWLTLQKFLWATQKWGIGIRTDSVAYLWGAENLAKGLGFGRLDGAGIFRPYAHWPPLYSIFLAGFESTGYNNLESARIFGAVCVVILTILTGLTIARFTDNSPWYVAGALIILTTSPNFWDTTVFAMTEPLYLIMSLAALLLLDIYLERKKSIYLVFASLFIGLALMTRYVGISLIIACSLVLLLQKGYSWQRKIMQGLLLCLFAFVPTGIWIVRNLVDTGTATNRVFSLTIITPVEWAAAGSAILNWITPIQKMPPIGLLKPLLILSLTFIASIIYFRFAPRHENEAKHRFIGLIALYTLSYTISVVLARLYFDPSIPLDEYRIQYPLFLGLFMLIIYGLYRIQTRIYRSSWFLSVIVVCIFILGAWVIGRAYMAESIDLTTNGHYSGFGMARIKDINRPLLAALKPYSLQNNRFFTDNIEKLYLLNKFYSYQVTSAKSDEVEYMLSNTDEYGVVLVLFDRQVLGPVYRASIPGMQLVFQGNADVYAAPRK